MEDKKDRLFEKEMDMKKVMEGIYNLLENYTMKEIMKMMREISYDVVSYYGPSQKGQIYDGSYSEINVEQASRIQQRLRDMADLFTQSVVDHREFDEEYLRKYLG